MSSASLFSLAYFSRNEVGNTPEQLHAAIASILASARRNNLHHGITGALLFSDGCFAQVLEGPQDAVEAIFETIQCDLRHSHVTVLKAHPIDARSFGELSMAFGGIDGVSTNPNITADGMGNADDILAVEEGRSLLAALRSVVHRDDLALRDEKAGR